MSLFMSLLLCRCLQLRREIHEAVPTRKACASLVAHLSCSDLALAACYYSSKTFRKRFRQRIRVGPTLPTAMPRRAATSA